jgi:tetratricopeptide (TPR) repeat protein
MTRPFCILFAALVATTQSLDARAQTGAAEALFQSGREAMERENFQVAREKFEESNRLEPAVGTLLNLALCEERLGRRLAAWHHLRRVIEALPPNDDRLPIAQEHYEEIDLRLARVTLLAAPTLKPDAAIRFGATLLTRSSFGIPIPIEAGPSRLAVDAPGRQPRVYLLTLREGARETLLVEPGPAIGRIPRELRAGPSAQEGNPYSTTGWIALGVGSALVVAGAGAGMAAVQAKNDMDRECDAQLLCSGRGIEAADRGESFAVVSTLAFGAGALGLAAGTWLLLSGRRSDRPASATQVSLLLGSPGVGVGGSFR